eukprot:PhM_4_TR15926/c1_g2_i6/m.54486
MAGCGPRRAAGVHVRVRRYCRVAGISRRDALRGHDRDRHGDVHIDADHERVRERHCVVHRHVVVVPHRDRIALIVAECVRERDQETRPTTTLSTKGVVLGVDAGTPPVTATVAATLSRVLTLTRTPGARDLMTRTHAATLTRTAYTHALAVFERTASGRPGARTPSRGLVVAATVSMSRSASNKGNVGPHYDARDAGHTHTAATHHAAARGDDGAAADAVAERVHDLAGHHVRRRHIVVVAVVVVGRRRAVHERL